MRIRRSHRGMLLAAALVTALAVALPAGAALAATTAAQTGTIAITGQAGKVVAVTGVARAYAIGGAAGQPGVVAIDTATGTSLGPVAALQGEQIVDIAASPTSSLVVAVYTVAGVGKLAYIDGATGAVSTTIDLPSAPGLVAVSDGGAILIESPDVSAPTMILVVNQQVVNTGNPVQGRLADLEFAPTAATQGRVQAVGVSTTGQVTTFDLGGNLVASYFNTSLGAAPTAVAFQPGTAYLLVASASRDEVAVFGYTDLRQSSGVGQVGTVSLYAGVAPTDLVFSPDGTTAYIVNAGDTSTPASVSVVNGQGYVQLSVVQDFRLATPAGVTVATSGTTVLVADGARDEIAVITATPGQDPGPAPAPAPAPPVSVLPVTG